MKNWYYSKDPNERRIINIVAALVVLSLFYLLIWAPISDAFDRNQVQLQQKQRLLTWVQNSAREIIQLRGTGNSAATAAQGPLLTTVDRTIKTSGLSTSMKRLEPQGSDKVQIWFEQSGFDQIISWLALLHSKHQVQVESINIERQPNIGQVNVRVVLVRGA